MNTLKLIKMCTLIATSLFHAQAVNLFVTDQQVRQFALDRGIDLEQRWKQIISEQSPINSSAIEHIKKQIGALINNLIVNTQSYFDQSSWVHLDDLLAAAGIINSSDCFVRENKPIHFECSVCNGKILRTIKAPSILQTHTIRTARDRSINAQEFVLVLCSLIHYHLEYAVSLHEAHNFEHDLTMLPQLGILISTSEEQPLFVSGHLDKFIASINAQHDTETEEITGDELLYFKNGSYGSKCCILL